MIVNEALEYVNNSKIPNSEAKYFIRNLIKVITDSSEYKELHDIKRFLNDLKSYEKGGKLYVDGEVFTIRHLCSMDELE